MSRFIDMRGQKFGRLIVLNKPPIKKIRKFYWECKCICGNHKNIPGINLRIGITKSCGCLKIELTKKNNRRHGMINTRFYRIFNHIKSRCNDKKVSCYNNYGGRGIKNEWKDFSEFKEDMYKSYQYHVKKYGKDNTSIERKNNNGNYSKKNCEWSTHRKQSNNKRNTYYLKYNLINKPLSYWAEEYNINYHTLYCRLNKSNWSIKKALETPVLKK